MSTMPWAKWFWSDWESDAALRVCSLAAQGLWMRMLCIAAQHEPIGYVAVNGIGCTIEDIAKLGGVPVEEAERLVQELEARGVFSRNGKGTIYNRRMVRDAKKAKKARENGKKGGNPTLSKQSEIPPSDNLEPKGGDNTQKPEARSQKPEDTTLEKVVDLDAAREAKAAASDVSRETIRLLKDTAWELAECAKSARPFHQGVVDQWAAEGCKVQDLLVIPTVLARERARRQNPTLVLPLEYYTDAVRDARIQRTSGDDEMAQIEAALRRWVKGEPEEKPDVQSA